jgi:hypothetical protein
MVNQFAIGGAIVLIGLLVPALRAVATATALHLTI